MPGGRPRSDRSRTALLSARFTALEMRIIERRAAVLGISKSDYLRYAALGFIPQAYNPLRAKEIRVVTDKALSFETIAQAERDKLMQERFKLIMRAPLKSDWSKYLKAAGYPVKDEL